MKNVYITSLTPILLREQNSILRARTTVQRKANGNDIILPWYYPCRLCR